MLMGVFWQGCYVHLLRNALDCVPRKVDDDCLLELRWMYDRRDRAEVRRIWPPGSQDGVAGTQAHRLGRGEYREDSDLLPPAAGASQSSSVTRPGSRTITISHLAKEHKKEALRPAALRCSGPPRGCTPPLGAVARQRFAFEQASDGGSEGMARPDPMIVC